MPDKQKAMNRGRAKKGTFGRIIKSLFRYYPVLSTVMLICIIFSSAVSSIPALFMQRIFDALTELPAGSSWLDIKDYVISNVLLLGTFYVISVIAILLYTQMGAVLTQGTLYKMRREMFEKMQNLPISFFDTHKYGDIMSTYTNDIDAIRQLIGQSLPSLVASSVIVTTVFSLMCYFSVWLALVVVVGVAIMVFLSRYMGGTSSKFFIRQQRSMGKTEGYVQEMMSGQKVIKVFCHEEESKRGFDEVNEGLFEDSRKANQYANMLMPIINNIGNILYVLVALTGGLLLMFGTKNLALSGMPLTLGIAVSFLNMTKQFAGNVGQVSNQINSIIMGLAGASRVFELMDEEKETDDGYVTLVNAKVGPDGEITECPERTHVWAWKHPHGDGTTTYTQLKGDVRLLDVDFAYLPGKTVLHNITLYAEPGQKVAFVGATGAGKTTITNLINRFYDIADGKIRYDGININKIRKSDLRRSLGVVLQDTNLFTGTVMDNIRYGRLDATDEECIEAAKLAGADDFITRLPDGYKTVLTSNGANLSQGQRQLLAISRAAVADPPVIIMDEATSSIDTRTEAIVQRGMDKLMEGRTVFVIAHRLSTVRNSDVIMVLDHGRIIERGDHEKLIADRGTYYKLYTGAFELE